MTAGSLWPQTWVPASSCLHSKLDHPHSLVIPSLSPSLSLSRPIVHLSPISILTDVRFHRFLPRSHLVEQAPTVAAKSLQAAPTALRPPTASHRLQWLLCRWLCCQRSPLWFLKSLVIARILRQPAPAPGRIKPRRAHTETGRPPNQLRRRQINCRAKFLLRRRRSWSSEARDVVQ